MTPTAKLRWVERDMAVSLGAILYGKTQKVRVLQQWWLKVRPDTTLDEAAFGAVKPADGEWLDVLLEEET